MKTKETVLYKVIFVILASEFYSTNVTKSNKGALDDIYKVHLH